MISNPKITRKEIAYALEMSDDGIKYNINQLKNRKIIRRVGGDKGGRWVVKGKKQSLK